MKTLLRGSALIIALVMLCGLTACSGEGKAPSVTEAPSVSGAPAVTDAPEGTGRPDTAPVPADEETELDPEQEERVKKLAAAFSLFGDCDVMTGVDMKRIESMVYCYYTFAGTEDPDVPGYCRVPKEEADSLVETVFRGVKLMDAIRVKYDPGREQDYYYSNGSYFVRAAAYSPDPRIISVRELLDAKGAKTGLRAIVLVSGGEGFSNEIRLDLIPEENGEFSLTRAQIMING